MRRTSDALPGLATRHDLVRSVQTPEFAGITFHEVLAKTALNQVPGASKRCRSAGRSTRTAAAATPASSASPARTHEYLDLDGGNDFDTQIVVKVNVAEVLATGARPPELGAASGRARHQHRPVPAGRGALPVDARDHRGARRLRHAVHHPDQGHAAAPRPAAAAGGRRAGAGRPRHDDRRVRRRAARVGRARRADHRGAARDRHRRHGGRAERLGVPDAGAAVPHRLDRAPRAAFAAIRMPGPTRSRTPRSTCGRVRASGTWPGWSASTPTSCRATARCTARAATPTSATARGSRPGAVRPLLRAALDLERPPRASTRRRVFCRGRRGASGPHRGRAARSRCRRRPADALLSAGATLVCTAERAGSLG